MNEKIIIDVEKIEMIELDYPQSTLYKLYRKKGYIHYNWLKLRWEQETENIYECVPRLKFEPTHIKESELKDSGYIVDSNGRVFERPIIKITTTSGQQIKLSYDSIEKAKEEFSKLEGLAFADKTRVTINNKN